MVSSERRRVRRVRNPLVAEIVEVLMDAAGSAHQDVVISQIAARRGELQATESLAREIVAGFEDYLAKARRRRDRPTLLKRAFGEDSRRWALEPAAYALFEAPTRPQAAWPVRLQA